MCIPYTPPGGLRGGEDSRGEIRRRFGQEFAAGNRQDTRDTGLGFKGPARSVS